MSQNVSYASNTARLNICQGDTIALQSSYANSIWNTNDISDFLVVSDSGLYYSVYSEECLFAVDSFFVMLDTFILNPELPLDTTFCNINPFINVELPINFTFMDEDRKMLGNILLNPKPGTYYYYSKNSCNEINDSIVIKRDSLPLELPKEIQLCDSEISVDLDSGLSNTLWNTGYIGQVITVNEEGLYSFNTINACGEFHYDTKVTTIGELELPNIFSPNGDNINDIFPFAMNYDFSLSVYDRWGNLIFDDMENWDGKFNGSFVPNGVYFYIFEYQYCQDRIYYGNVTVLK